jgi:TrmH family RNA methyltransferase
MKNPFRITSPANDRVKALVRLRTRRERDERGLMIVEDPLVIRRALAAGLAVSEVWACPEQQPPAAAALYAELVAAGVPPVEVTPAVMDKVSYGERSDGLLVLAPRRERTLADLTLPADRPALLVVLEAVEKPGNVGAVLRIADGAGADAVLVCDGTGDLDNPNCLRASRGARFTVPAVAAPGDEARSWLREHGVRIVAAAPAGAVPWDETDLTGPVALVLGAEHEGLSAAWLAAADRTVTIPMAGAADSLNVASSGAVLLYEAVRQRRAAGKRTRP